MNEQPKEGDTIIKARICPIEDGTCPTTVFKLQKRDNDPRHCGYDAHIIRANILEKFNGINTMPEVK